MSEIRNPTSFVIEPKKFRICFWSHGNQVTVHSNAFFINIIVIKKSVW